MVQRKSRPLLFDDFWALKEKMNEVMLTLSTMNPFNPDYGQHLFVCKEETLELRLFLWYLSVFHCWEKGWRESMMNERNSQVMTWEWVWATSSKTWQGTQFTWSLPDVGAGLFLLHQFLVGVSGQGQPVSHYWIYSPFSALDLLNWKSQNPSYQDDPKIYIPI